MKTVKLKDERWLRNTAALGTSDWSMLYHPQRNRQCCIGIVMEDECKVPRESMKDLCTVAEWLDERGGLSVLADCVQDFFHVTLDRCEHGNTPILDLLYRINDSQTLNGCYYWAEHNVIFTPAEQLLFKEMFDGHGPRLDIDITTDEKRIAMLNFVAERFFGFVFELEA
jgi:hypothetical protein